jgi:hypothetical protein
MHGVNLTEVGAILIFAIALLACFGAGWGKRG